LKLKKNILLLALMGASIVLLNSKDVIARDGIASVYSTREGGSQSASGIKLNDNALTAAHRTLPFGSKVRVTNTKNGRSVVVTITDRGPFVRGRVIDLTPAAARAIGFNGLAKVTVQTGG
jgi:rare lipoprotein A